MMAKNSASRIAAGAGIKFAKVKADSASPAYAPVQENVTSGAYPISRDLYIYMRERPEGKTKDFIDWILSDAGQALVASAGYFPLRAVESGKGLAEQGEAGP